MFYCSWNSGFLNPHEEAHYGKIQSVELLLELERIEQIYEGKHKTADNVRAAYFGKGNRRKNKKGLHKRD